MQLSGPGSRATRALKTLTWGIPNIRGTLLGDPIIRIKIFWGLYRGPPILGNYQMNWTKMKGTIIAKYPPRKGQYSTYSRGPSKAFFLEMSS